MKRWQVQWQRGGKTFWCLLPPGAKPDPDAFHDNTACNHFVTLRWSSRYTEEPPTCPDCLDVIELAYHMQRKRP